MTFSVVGRCQSTGMFGVAIATSSICVGARCPHVRAGVGAVATQNVTDPTYGPRVLDLLARGHDADDALARAIAPYSAALRAPQMRSDRPADFWANSSGPCQSKLR